MSTQKKLIRKVTCYVDKDLKVRYSTIDRHKWPKWRLALGQVYFWRIPSTHWDKKPLHESLAIPFKYRLIPSSWPGDIPRFYCCGSNLEDHLRGRRLGKKMYEQIFRCFPSGVVILPHSVHGSGANTIHSARVWKSLAKKYPSVGAYNLRYMEFDIPYAVSNIQPTLGPIWCGP